MYRYVFKRLFDLAVASTAMILLAPVVFLVALLVRIQHGTPIIFVQQRPGLNGKPFTIYKFRTMTNKKGPDGQLLPDADRLTQFGRFLRASSLDELPELINVIRGDMSLVGPRPLLMQYLGLYSPQQARRHNVRPGITGWAQINGRNALSWEEKFELDVWYVDHCSLALDIQIIKETIATVLNRDGISQQNHATMPIFTGNQASLDKFAHVQKTSHSYLDESLEHESA
ncbi:MAG: sugar transferase [Anaerolineae bacterium]|nr:sugar transferase [Anaerolineae bacterium]